MLHYDALADDSQQKEDEREMEAAIELGGKVKKLAMDEAPSNDDEAARQASFCHRVTLSPPLLPRGHAQPRADAGECVHRVQPRLAEALGQQAHEARDAR